MTFAFIANSLGGLGAVSCVGLLPFWIMGVPGTMAIPYAKGWMMSFQVLWLYPTVFLAEFTFFALAGWLAGPGGFHWLALGGAFSLVLLLVATCRMIQALRIMLG